ncbi:MAG: hypothetical protein MI723_00800, partial [Caulobacterales bacterium]|nr:hypothetical protein [Caulobacterales bacterium]
MASLGSRVFVATVFVVFAAAFIAETAALYLEYRGREFGDGSMWFTLAAFDSQTFVFFPIAGIAAL